MILVVSAVTHAATAVSATPIAVYAAVSAAYIVTTSPSIVASKAFASVSPCEPSELNPATTPFYVVTSVSLAILAALAVWNAA